MTCISASLRGTYLIAMFSHTALAKEFRRWVLDVLDRETAAHPQPLTVLTDDELHSLAWLWRAADYMMGAARRIYPLLDVAEHREAGTYYSIIHEYPMTLAAAQRILAEKNAIFIPLPTATETGTGFSTTCTTCRQPKVGKCEPCQ
ncbi:P22AR C-terminal domain-containing protein [Aeromonas salmonicida]|jgi:hypothetical protein|uniref:P22AR C-terminal domain-containing protein n=1 Tax=Aeromonas salmonicida TaxID=645 RepID=UPI00232C718F|nr:P22AR C-terminal domain-containing protein [Aeromonas salmonicida]WCH24365.1 hypothetical protein ONZ54_08590 [Aeromonas salmonicida]